jgi:PAS domain S-box-containing protein
MSVPPPKTAPVSAAHNAPSSRPIDEPADGLHASEAHFRIIAENVPDLVTVLDADGRRIYASPSYENVLGIPPRELLGKPILERIHPDDQRLVETAMREIIQTGAGRTIEYRNRHRDDSWRVMECHASPVRNDARQVAQIVFVARDITRRKKDEELDLHREVQFRHLQKMEAIGQLAAGIAHEINTPTQYIGDNTHFVQDGFADIARLLAAHARLLEAARADAITPALLAEVEAIVAESDIDYLLEEIPKAIRQSLEGVARVSKIVGAMKEFSHPGSDEKTAIDLNRAVDSALTVATNEWKYVANLVTDFDPALPPVPCLPSEISQVIVNIVVNAAHAIADVARDRGEKGTITVSTRAAGAWAEIRIADTGTGIPPEIRQKIFDPFFTTKGVGRGTGQGLAIAHSVVVDKHGGVIEVESEMGRGTTFLLRLPICAAASEGRTA